MQISTVKIPTRIHTFRLSPLPRSITFLYRLNRLIAILRDERKSSSEEACQQILKKKKK